MSSEETILLSTNLQLSTSRPQTKPVAISEAHFISLKLMWPIKVDIYLLKKIK